MMYFLNILDEIAESNAIFTILIVILIVISLSSLYLIYTQNKINSRNINQNYSGSEDKSKQVSIIEEIISDNEESTNSLNNLPYTNEEVDYRLNDLKQLDDINSKNDDTDYIMLESDINDLKKEPIDIDDSSKIDSFNLKDVTRELETIPRERTINLTPFEAAQEESAIISYDELINRVEMNNNVSYDRADNINISNATANVGIEEKINVDNSIEHEFKNSVTGYEHEEAFLDALKQLQKLLN